MNEKGRKVNLFLRYKYATRIKLRRTFASLKVPLKEQKNYVSILVDKRKCIQSAELAKNTGETK